MKQTLLLTAVLLLSNPALQADDPFRAAALAEIRRTAPAISESDMTLLASPPLRGPLQRVRVANARYDSALRRWQLQLQCIPRQACLSAVALLSSQDPALSHLSVRPNSPPIVHAGERRELVTTVGAVRIRQVVICLQSARAGESIRVRQQNGHRIWLVTVNSDGTLAPGSRS